VLGGPPNPPPPPGVPEPSSALLLAAGLGLLAAALRRVRAAVAGAIALVAGMAAPAAVAGLIVSAPVDVIGNLPAARFTMAGYGTRAYKDWGNEPFVAVNPVNTNDVFISSFLSRLLSQSAVTRMCFTRPMAEPAGPPSSQYLRLRAA
jgi:hypothetical protein